MKQCKTCKKLKPLKEFPKDNSRPRGYRANCKKCSNRRYREYCKKNDYYKKRYQVTKDDDRWRAIYRKYKITKKEYLRILSAQKGRCAICNTEDSGKRPFCVDHNHENGKVRGLLCTPCNQMIGHAKDDPNRLKMAVKYLEASSRKSRVK